MRWQMNGKFLRQKKTMMLSKMYDLNVWDKGANEGGDSYWAISVHKLVEQYGYMSTGDHLPNVLFLLTEQEAKQLTLGVAESDGGLYGSDEDFFIDANSFVEVYGDRIPQRVLEFVNKWTWEDEN